MSFIRTKLQSFGFKQWFFLALNSLLVLACIGSLAGLHFVSGALVSLTAAERFRGGSETRFAQLACFLPEGQGKSEEDIRAFRQALDGKLVEQSLEAPENGSLYLDAYCGTGTVTISGNGNASLAAIGVGGDFFYFHPLLLRSGSYIKDGDLMDDLVVLDEETAWRLYGSADLAGMPVTINGKQFIISGVISREDDFATQKAYHSDGGIFLSYSALTGLQEDTDITCYELVMPDPISGYAKSVVTETFSIGDGDIVENSGRYTLGHLWEVIKSFGDRSMRTNGVMYPYWENAARLTEDYAALLTVLTVLFALCPASFVLVNGIRYVRKGYRFAKKKVPEKVEAAVEKRREVRLEREFEKKAGD